MLQNPPRYRIGLAASRAHQDHADSALVRLLAGGHAAIATHLQPHLIVVGRTLDAICSHNLLPGYQAIERFPYGREGGLMMLVSRVVDTDPAQALDAVIYLMDPVDPSSNFPEALALKRQCVIHGKPFMATEAAALEWLKVESLHAGLDAAQAPGAALLQAMSKQVVALIAHDALKTQMVEFAGIQFDLLSRYAERVATGTTGGLLNEMAWSRGWPRETPWVTPYRSGPLGGDAQIAERVLDGTCDKVIFFEDPHVARQHEADIQLMERAVCSASERTTCMNSPAMAWRWAEALSRVKG